MPPREDWWAWASPDSCFDSRLEESSSEYRPRTTGTMTVSVTTASMIVKPRSRPGRVLTGIAEPHEDGLPGLTQSRKRARSRLDRHGDLLDGVTRGADDPRREVGAVLLDRVCPLERVAIPARPRRCARRGRAACRRIVPTRKVVIAVRVDTDQASTARRRHSGRRGRVRSGRDREPRVGGRIADQLFELLPGERVGARELVGGGARLHRAGKERGDREQPEGEKEEREHHLDQREPALAALRSGLHCQPQASET